MQTARCLLLLALLATAAQGAEVYRSKAKDGSVTYSDRPENDSSEFVTMVQGPRAAGAQTTAAQRAQRPGAQGASARPADSSAPEAAATPAPCPQGPPLPSCGKNGRRIATSRKNASSVTTVSRRLFKTNDKGEREYLDDKAVAEAKAKAAQDVKDWCG